MRIKVYNFKDSTFWAISKRLARSRHPRTICALELILSFYLQIDFYILFVKESISIKIKHIVRSWVNIRSVRSRYEPLITFNLKPTHKSCLMQWLIRCISVHPILIFNQRLITNSHVNWSTFHRNPSLSIFSFW